MGQPMRDIHAPTVDSGPTTTRSAADGVNAKPTVQELIKRKDDLEAELSALGSVLDSVGT